MLTVILGLSSALIFGSSDFLGGLAAKRMGSMLATAVAAGAGLVPLAIFAIAVPGTWGSEVWLWGAIAGVAGALAIMLIYASLAIGPMSILSPLGALVGASVPVLWSAATGERLSVIGYVALVLALVAILLISFVREKSGVRPSLRGLLVAGFGGVFIGVFMITVDRVPSSSGVNVLVVDRAVSTSIMFATAGVMALIHFAHRRGWFGRDGRPRADIAVGDQGARNYKKGFTIAICAGFIEAIANIFLIYGVFSGELSVISVLIALYPAGTILLAALVLKERVSPLQYGGMALAIVASGMLALS